jgi:5-methyltetrahydrofolate--homocysteine methyltransferase
MSRFLDALHSGRVLLMDGAMGTELQLAGIKDGECYERCNLTHAKIVEDVHRFYVDAGAECILTNTFQANPQALERFGLAHCLEEICAAALALAGSVAGLRCFVIGDIGPLDKPGWRTIDFVIASMRKVDAYLLETLSHLDSALCILRASDVEANPEQVPVLMSFSFEKKARAGKFAYLLRDGESPEVVAKKAHRFCVAALGVNCGPDIDMEDVAEIIRQYRSATDLPLFARPNAGTPKRVADRWLYPQTPEMMAAKLRDVLEAGATMVGGCCGTTPEHIAAFRVVVDRWNAEHGHG